MDWSSNIIHIGLSRGRKANIKIFKRKSLKAGFLYERLDQFSTQALNHI